MLMSDPAPGGTDVLIPVGALAVPLDPSVWLLFMASAGRTTGVRYGLFDSGAGGTGGRPASGAYTLTLSGSADDYYEWGALLRSVSAFEIYRKVYRDTLTPQRVAELLILRPEMPRSLVACMRETNSVLRLIANQESSETERRAGALYARLQYGQIDHILERGLHAYLTQFLQASADLGARISSDFLVSAI